ncbi:phage Gp37/Gp68 family protein [Anaeroselena agilis]|uniref:Phage Gp37/Gp68 family protein n=1 Tax=Anaeroselena agilis TaxID=3063788 RepID=A0ABU3NZH8_9FIRM|nr:phage Gp37/Gp68 family protein [Selenomonadales bacterium 4137-cl]
MATKIEWTDETWNPFHGCDPISPGCANCYARTMAKRQAAMGTPGYDPEDPFRVTLAENKLHLPLRWRKPRKIFIGSMGDLFHEEVPFAFIEKVWDIFFDCGAVWPAGSANHIFQVLTKRPERLLAFARWMNGRGRRIDYPNVWMGVTAENQEWADKRIPVLLQVPAAVRFVSYEPALGPIKLPFGWNGARRMPDGLNYYWTQPFIDWFIAGAESGPDARPAHPDWFRSARDQCAAAGVPFFFKSWGTWLPDMDCTQRVMYPNRGCWTMEDPPMNFIRRGKEMPGDLLDGQLHKEFPKVVNS